MKPRPESVFRIASEVPDATSGRPHDEVSLEDCAKALRSLKLFKTRHYGRSALARIGASRLFLCHNLDQDEWSVVRCSYGLEKLDWEERCVEGSVACDIANDFDGYADLCSIVEVP